MVSDIMLPAPVAAAPIRRRHVHSDADVTRRLNLAQLRILERGQRP